MDALRQALKERVVTVVFTKRDGSQRTMKCTQRQHEVETVGTVGGGRPTPVDNLAVIDVEIMQWRSFKLDSVISWE